VLAAIGLLVIPAEAQPSQSGSSKIENSLAAELNTEGSADFYVEFAEQADLSAASAIADWNQRGAAVVAALRRTADASQSDVRKQLTATETAYQAFWVANTVLVRNGSDSLAQTLAAVACFGSSPTRVRGIGFIRGKETDRIGAVVTELRRAGIDAVEHDDGFTVRPGTPEPTSFETYDDHRMAMSLALLGLRVPGIRIRQPGCVAKTYPAYFADLARLGGTTAR